MKYMTGELIEIGKLSFINDVFFEITFKIHFIKETLTVGKRKKAHIRLEINSCDLIQIGN